MFLRVNLGNIVIVKKQRRMCRLFYFSTEYNFLSLLTCLLSKILNRKVKLLKNSLSILQLNIKSYQLEENLLPKIHKRLYYVPGTPVISNCGKPKEKTSEFLDNKLKDVM